MNRKKIWIPVVIVGLMMGFVLYFSGFHIDLSQEYRSFPEYKKIIFKDSWSGQCYKLCAWGLTKCSEYHDFSDNRNYKELTGEYEKMITDIKLENSYVNQIAVSPDEKYILFVERVYRGSGTTDDEDVYYRVYSIDEEYVYTVYSAYKQFLLVDWVK